MNVNNSKKRVIVVGAGTAGLTALKNSLQHGMEVTAFEQGTQIGGTWVYNDNVQYLESEEDMHSSMYEGLRTNLPKEIMGYPDFSYPNTNLESFVTSADVLNFLESYAEHFDLKKHIKFGHEVIRIRPRHGEWEVYVWDKKKDDYDILYFDYVFVCNGHYTKPIFPEIEGHNIFRGKQLHSHLYRKAEMFRDSKVLIIGAGPSGIDIANHIRKVAGHVFLSHHLLPPPDTKFMKNVTQKPDVLRFTETGAIFKDETTEVFDFIIYCTGYKYSFPFLTADCTMRVRNNHVYPLYKHCININHPTMAIIGLPVKVCPTQVFDLQVRFALKFFSKQKNLPNREEMLADLNADMEERWKSGLKETQAHEMGDRQFDYYKQLSETAEIENIKPVIGKIMDDCGCKYIYSLENYRDNCFKIIDDNNFVKFSVNPEEKN